VNFPFYKLETCILRSIRHSTDPVYERLPDFWSWKDNNAHAQRLDCEGWTKRQYPLNGDFNEDNEDVEMLTQPKRPRGLPMELSTGDDGRILIPVEIRNAMWEEKRDFMQTYVKMAWRECGVPQISIYTDFTIALQRRLSKTSHLHHGRA
jgi:hypothetical protein